MSPVRCATTRIGQELSQAVSAQAVSAQAVSAQAAVARVGVERAASALVAPAPTRKEVPRRPVATAAASQSCLVVRERRRPVARQD
jgi:hypothetical protein